MPCNTVSGYSFNRKSLDALRRLKFSSESYGDVLPFLPHDEISTSIPNFEMRSNTKGRNVGTHAARMTVKLSFPVHVKSEMVPHVKSER